MLLALATVGLPVADEGTGGFGAKAAAQLERLQERYGLPVTGDLDPATGGVLSLASLMASEHDPARLREGLLAARGAVSGSRAYDAALARFALISGSYDIAAGVRGPLHDTLGNDITPVMTDGFGSAPPRAPEVAFPENFYSYRYPLMAQGDIDDLRRARVAVTEGDVNRGGRVQDAAEVFLAAIESWQHGNGEMAKRRYTSAAAAYDRCQQAALSYFAINPDYNFKYTAATLPDRIDELTWKLNQKHDYWPVFSGYLEVRRQRLSLAELGQVDWISPSEAPAVGSGHMLHAILRGNLAGHEFPVPAYGSYDYNVRMVMMDVRVFVLAAVLAPLARGEANRHARRFEPAIGDFRRLLRRRIPNPTLDTPLPLTIGLLCELIEVPFTRLLLIETLSDQAEAAYKARARVDDLRDEAARQDAVARIDVLAQDFTARGLVADPRPGAEPFQHLVAALTYVDALDVIVADGGYAARARTAVDSLDQVVTATTAGNGGTTDLATAARSLTLPTVLESEAASPGGTHPHETLVQFQAPPDETTMRERNPRTYALLLHAHGRLLQIWCGFNYLGYRDDYLPPWRFAFLLDRARYFAEHAKNAQRDYLSFLANAENEELRELGAAQQVELEKANVAIETARVEHASREVTAAHESKALAAVVADHARKRREAYEEFDDWALGFDIANRALSFGQSIAVAMAGGGASGGGTVEQHVMGVVQGEMQRDLEKLNLKFAEDEAKWGRRIADAQLQVARSGLVIAGLQRQAALMRHCYALQTLQLMRERTLNSELWDRLAVSIRGVADSYLRYGIEISFLAQQAYNFEADKRLSVIRFDYDLSDVGAMLAADFLLRDLDTLEQDQLVTQTARLQQVRYVVSLAREYPDTLRSLAEDGSATLTVRLEQLERRFPGLLGLRISSVEILPIALMDPTRVSVQLTNLGVGQVRLAGQASGTALDASDANSAEDWLANAGSGWPIKVHATGSETAVFTGLSRQEIAGASAITASERGAFEGSLAAASWRIDLSMRENQIVPDTLADVMVTFVLGGTYDGALGSAVTTRIASALPRPTTRLISARRVFPDAYYSLVRYGRLTLPIADRHLSISGTPRQLRNLALALPLAGVGPELGRSYCRYPIEVDVAPGSVTVLTLLPQVRFTLDGLTLHCRYESVIGPVASEVIWDFGDRSGLVGGTDVQHVYGRAGRYELRLRLVHDSRLIEYRAAVVVSAQHAVTEPLVVIPTFTATSATSDGTVPVTISVAATFGVTIDCRTGDQRARSLGSSAEIALSPGRHVLRIVAMRGLSAHFFGDQRYAPEDLVVLDHGRATTSRTYDSDGNETTPSLDAFSSHVFGTRVLSPVDRWTLDLPLSKNAWFRSVSAGDVEQTDCSELSDAVLVLDYIAE